MKPIDCGKALYDSRIRLGQVLGAGLKAQAIIVAVVVAQFFPAPLSSQHQLLLRYDPIRDVDTHTLFQTVARLEMTNGRTIETADLGSMRSVALELAEGGTVLHLTYDSVRARVRSNGGSWREFRVPGTDSVWAQAKVDSQLNVSSVLSGSPLPEVTGLLDVVTGVPGVTLPTRPVRLGGAWLIDSRLPDRISASVPREIGELPSMNFSTRIKLDSTVQRTQDTLGYFTLSGYIRPTTDSDLQSLAESGLTVAAELEGQLIWSSGWKGFVSGTNRVTMEISNERPSATPTIEQQEPALTLYVTTRFRVQP